MEIIQYKKNGNYTTQFFLKIYTVQNLYYKLKITLYKCNLIKIRRTRLYFSLQKNQGVVKS